jgi:hypothetical protein
MGMKIKKRFKNIEIIFTSCNVKGISLMKPPSLDGG